MGTPRRPQCQHFFVKMFFESEELSGPVVDLNKSFYFDEDLEIDLKQPEEQVMEEAFFDLKCLSLKPNEKTKLASRVKPAFLEETMPIEVVKKMKSSLKRCQKCEVLLNSEKVRRHEKRCKPFSFQLLPNQSNISCCVKFSSKNKDPKMSKSFSRNSCKSKHSSLKSSNFSRKLNTGSG